MILERNNRSSITNSKPKIDSLSDNATHEHKGGIAEEVGSVKETQVGLGLLRSQV